MLQKYQFLCVQSKPAELGSTIGCNWRTASAIRRKLHKRRFQHMPQVVFWFQGDLQCQIACMNTMPVKSMQSTDWGRMLGEDPLGRLLNLKKTENKLPSLSLHNLRKLHNLAAQARALHMCPSHRDAVALYHSSVVPLHTTCMSSYPRSRPQHVARNCLLTSPNNQ